MTLEVLLVANGEVYLAEKKARRVRATKFYPEPQNARFATYAGVRYSILPGRVGRTHSMFFAVPTPLCNRYHEAQEFTDVFEFIRTLFPPMSRRAFEVHESGRLRAEPYRRSSRANR